VDLANQAFRLAHGRWPTSAELDVLMELYEAELERFLDDREAALELTRLAVPVPEEQEARLAGGTLIADQRPEQLAAWTVVANAILNTDGFVTRE
jgi:hypothetical protein